MPRIAYVCASAEPITGGIKAAFQHVEMLVDGGLDAVVATPDAQPPHWFGTRAPLISHSDLRADDVLVLPENLHGIITSVANSPNPKVVFCQNPAFVYQGLGPLASYAEIGATHILCPSYTVMRYCRRRFPELALGYTPYFVDHEVFTPAPRKQLRIAAIPRKRMVEYGTVYDLFRSCYPQLSHVEWVFIEQATEAQVAQAMGESAVFLSMARLEAHGMTALEAMASGCIVAGFTGVPGGCDSSTAANGLWAPEDDVVTCTDQLARAVQMSIGQGADYRFMREAGSLTALQYRREESSRLLVGFWKRTLGEMGVG